MSTSPTRPAALRAATNPLAWYVVFAIVGVGLLLQFTAGQTVPVLFDVLTPGGAP